MRTLQRKKELNALMRLAARIHPQVILEIGVDQGGTLSRWIELLNGTGLIIGIDRNPDTINILNSTLGDKMNGVCKIIIGDTKDPLTLAMTQSALKGRLVDFLFIDGNHSYEAVKSDYEIFSPLVRLGGIIALHDIAVPATVVDPYDKSKFCGVKKFWSELKAEKKREYIDYKFKDHAYGIGVIVNDAG
ncbi:MAG: class I SAM-dependent methyltransferase [Candidatus Aminicenantes bacterium]|nr:class I SAM-dependent methyltransferase [Candidatus Aminicenantes bacterium]